MFFLFCFFSLERRGPNRINYPKQFNNDQSIWRKDQGFSWLVIFETGRDCFDTFGGKKNDAENGRDGTKMNTIVGWMGRDGTVGMNFSTGRDGTAR